MVLPTESYSSRRKEIETAVIKYMETDGDEIVSTQDILDSGVIPRLKNYKVKPGKVSDSIFGGPGAYTDKNTGQLITFENPPLNTINGIPIRIMVRTPRISTHDINRGEIPFKDQLLAINHNYMRRNLIPALGTSQFDIEGLSDNSIVIAAENLEQIPFENVLRAYMAESTTSTSLFTHYMNGSRDFCGHKLPDNLIANGRLRYIMDTPSTKSDEHDESISPQELFDRRICTLDKYNQIRNSSIFSFGIVSEILRNKGLIAVDTKTEHGINSRGEIVSQDEIWTMDSSGFWLLEDYNLQLEKLSKCEIDKLKPQLFSKAFARVFSKGEEGYTEEQRIKIAIRYYEGVEHITGKRFDPDQRTNKERVISGLEIVIDQLIA